MPDPLRSLRPEAAARFVDQPGLATPCLVIDEVTVDANIQAVLRLVGGPERWRAHVKTAKSGWAMGRLLEAGVTRFKASTYEEVRCLLELGAPDVLYALPAVGPGLNQLADLAERFPDQRVAVLLDSPAALETWGSRAMRFFLDVDSGMHRTGHNANDPRGAAALLDRAASAGHTFVGVHHYDGHLAGLPSEQRDARTGAGLDKVDRLIAALVAGGIPVPELVTGGSHTFLPALEHCFGPAVRRRVRVSPGTVTFCDVRSLERLGDVGLRPAVGVLARVLSAVGPARVTVDAGLTAIQVDAGSPHAAVSGLDGVEVGSPTQAHLALHFACPDAVPVPGELLCLIPRHVDTTVAQFGSFLVLRSDNTLEEHQMTARHHEVRR